MTLESSITQLNDSVQELIKVISALDTVAPKPKAVKASKPAAVKKAQTTTSFEFVGLSNSEECAVATDSTCAGKVTGSFVEPTTPVALVEAATEDNFPTLEEVIDEMRVITDREILSKIMTSFKVVRASDIAEDKRTAFIEALHMELQKGAA